jgi:hypothetical protein
MHETDQPLLIILASRPKCISFCNSACVVRCVSHLVSLVSTALEEGLKESKPRCYYICSLLEKLE